MNKIIAFIMVPVKLSNSLLLAKETQTTITDWGSTVLRVWSLQRSGLVPLKRMALQIDMPLI